SPTRSGGKQRQVRAEEQRRESRHRPGHAAEVVHADEDPARPGEEVAEPEAEPERECLARAATRKPQPGETGERRDGDWKQVERREPQHAGSAEQNGDEQRPQAGVERAQGGAQRAAPLHAAEGSFSTSSECSRRLSARNTRKRRPSSTVSSP